MFRMYGRKVEVLRYLINYTETDPMGNEPRNIAIYAPTKEEADELAKLHNGTVTPLELEDDAWMDGIVVDDVLDTRSAAMDIYLMGEEAYKLKIKPTNTQRIEALESALIAMMKNTKQQFEQFIRYQYNMGIINKEDVLSFVPRFITKEQAEAILNNK